MGENSSYPIKWNPISEENKKKKSLLFHDGSNELDNLISDPGGVSLPATIRDFAEKVYNFELRKDDVIVVTFPKCGTTWTQELMWQITKGVDMETSKKVHIMERSPFLEVDGLMANLKPPKPEEGKPPRPPFPKALDVAESLASPRVLKTHLPISLLNPALLDTCKVVYVCRNPKDTCVSFYYHHLNGKNMYKMKEENFELFAKYFKEGITEYGSYFYHLKDAWKHKDHPNMKFHWYEDMKKDLKPVIKDLSEFINCPLDGTQIDQLADFLDIDTMREWAVGVVKGMAAKAGEAGKAPKAGKAGEAEKAGKDMEEGIRKFFRKGKVGDWRNHFTPEMNEEWNDWIQENLEGTGITLELE